MTDVRDAQDQSPAERAAVAAQAHVNRCLDAGQHFRLEAGAGAGKTYSLVEALKRLIDQRGKALLQAGQKVACITYTEVARDEIRQDIEEHPAILVETIHSFCWSFVSKFQARLRAKVAAMEDRADKVAEGGGILGQPVEYDLGFFGIDERRITLSHDDIPRLMAEFLSEPKCRHLLKQLYPVIFIDEYQDTDKHFMGALSQHFFADGTGPLIGLFGDHWQTIYRSDYELAEFPNVEGIDKGSNFRSVSAVVDVLNNLRPELRQAVRDPNVPGEARFFHVNGYAGARTNTSHSKGDLPDDLARAVRARLRDQLRQEGWEDSNTKVLMLTHNALAAEQGYPTIAATFNRNEAFAKREDVTIAFLTDTLEPICRAYRAGRYGEMFSHLGNAPTIGRHQDKASWRDDMDELDRLRQEGTIGDVLDHLKATRRPRLPDRVVRREEELAAVGGEPVEGEASGVTRQRNLRAVPYTELVALNAYLDGTMPFATQHSVKGAEFENVLVVLGGGWNQYNWPKLLENLAAANVAAGDLKGFYRARNLFYVSVSRPKRRLAVLATQTLSQAALATAQRLFGDANIHELQV